MKINEARRNIRDQEVARMQCILNMSKEELAKEAKLRLKEELQYACSESPFYQKHIDKTCIQAFKETSELESIPFTTKEDLRSSYPYGLLATPFAKLIRYGESTGSTGKPTCSFKTYTDWERGNVWLERSLAFNFTEDDLVFIALPYELAFVSYDMDRALENIGVTVVPVGTMTMVCPWERTLEMMKVLHPTSLVCTPTRALSVFDMLSNQKYNPLDVNLKTLLYVGETCSSVKLKKIADLWGGIKLTTAYGTTETNSLALPCSIGRLHLSEDRFYFEVIDPLTRKPLREGERGELVLTSLHCEAMPLIRYRTGDIVKIENTQCECGMPHRTIHHLGRIHETINYQGKSILKLDMEATILSVENTGCYYLTLIEDGQFNVLVETTKSNSQSTLNAVKEKIYETHGIIAEINQLDKRKMLDRINASVKPSNLGIDSISAYRA